MTTATWNQIKLGGTGKIPSIGDGTTVRTAKIVIDLARIAKLTAGIVNGGSTGFTSSDEVALITLPTGTYFLGIDAEIITVLSTGGSNIGTTSGTDTEYVSAQSTTAVGRFGAYQSACVVPVILTTATTIYYKFTGTVSGMTGQIAVTVWYLEPANQDFPIAAYRTYTN